MISAAYAAAEEHAQSAGMPQFESSVFAHQIFWSIVSFLALLYLLNRFVLPTIQKLLDERSHKIRDDLQSAETIRLEAEKAHALLQRQIGTARQMSEQILEEARLESAKYREEAVEALTKELAKKRTTALNEIESAKNKALAEVRDVVVDVAIMATEKLIAKSVTKADANKMVQDALGAIQEHPLH